MNYSRCVPKKIKNQVALTINLSFDNMYNGAFQEMLNSEAAPSGNSRLQAVFEKLSGVIPRTGDLGAGSNAHKTIMSSDIIETVLADTPLPPRYEYDPYSESGERSAAVGLLSKRLEAELRAAKHTHLSCGEVLLPCGLLPRIASDILAMAESEPCGLRGCTLYLSFENDQECRKLSTVKCDPTTVSTFELYLTLKQDVTSWHSILPQFLKNLARGGTVMISSGYLLNKKKLYRSYQHTE